MAEALEILVSGGASAVGVDLYRPAPASGDAHDLAAWMTLSETIQRSPQIVLTELLPAHDALGMPAPRYAPPEQIGFNNILVDPGWVVRRGYLYAWSWSGPTRRA